MQSMYYIGLDVHKRMISYGKTAQPWRAGMEATVFTGWIYDAAALKVAHPLMLRAIAAAKKNAGTHFIQ